MSVYYTKDINFNKNSIDIINENDIDISYSMDKPQYKSGRKTICIVKYKSKIEISYANEYSINLLFCEINDYDIVYLYRNIYNNSIYTAMIQKFIELFVKDFKNILLEYFTLDINDKDFDYITNTIVERTIEKLETRD